MDLKSIRKYKDGVANEEEIVFVEQELEKARKMTEIIDAYEYKRQSAMMSTRRKSKSAKEVCKEKHSEDLDDIDNRSGTCCRRRPERSVRHSVRFCKQNRNYSKTEAEQIALTYVVKNFGESTKPVLAKSDEEIDYSSDLKHSVYVYEVKIYIGYVNEVEVKVNAKQARLWT